MVQKIVNPLPWDAEKRDEMKAQAEAKYYPASIDFALSVARERIDEWSYDEDAHGWCHERPVLLALADEVESLRAAVARVLGRHPKTEHGTCGGDCRSWDGHELSYPCPTVRALVGSA